MFATEWVFSTSELGSSPRGGYLPKIEWPIFDSSAFEANYGGAEQEAFPSNQNGSFLISRSTLAVQRFVRSREKVQATGLSGSHLVLLLFGGVRGSEGSNHANTQAGDLCIFDLNQPVESFVDSSVHLTMVVERDRLEQLAGSADLHGLVFRHGRPITRLLTDYLTELRNVSHELSPTDALLAVDVIGRLIRAGLGAPHPSCVDEQTVDLTTLRMKILRFIDEHLKHPELDALTIMRCFEISRATLYRALEADGGVATVIRERRLAAAHDLLARSRGLQIAEVASAYGFSSQNQFFKAFRRKFGFAPSEVSGTRIAEAIAPDIDEFVSQFAEEVHTL
jgi:AraC-like DNA-binding protein